MTVTVVGAGVVGLCVASALVDRDVPVRLVDRHPQPGPHACSWWAGGMLAPHCEGATAAEPVVRLGQQAAGWWAAHGATVVQGGSLVVAPGRDQRELDVMARRTTGHRWLDPDAIAAVEPTLAGRHERALLYPGEAHLDPRGALHALHEGLAARGVTVSTDVVDPDGAVVDCRGLAARDELVDLRGVKGEMLVLHAPEVALSRPVRLLHPRFPLYVVPRGDGMVMIGATQIESDAGGRASVRSVMELLSAAYALDPAFAEAELVEVGVDARPAFPDNLPRIRRRGTTVFVNGLFRHGFLLSPALAQMTADLLTGGETPELLEEDLHGPMDAKEMTSK